MTSLWHRLAAAAALTVLLLALPDVRPAAADESVPSNLQLMTQMSREVADELIAQFGSRLNGRAVTLKPFTSGEEYQLLTNVFTAALTDRGVTTYRTAGGRESDLILEYQALEFSLGYSKVYRSHLIGGKRVKRTAGVRIMTTLTSGSDGSVVWVGDRGRDHSDEFDFGEVQRVEQGEFEFVQPAVPSSGWSKVVEPVLVTGIIVGLIYLFFSNQSDS